MADQTERLLLQVDAATELLRRHLAEGEQPLDRFEKRVGKMAENVDRSIGDMGKRFGAFSALAEDAATRAQKSFEDSFTQVQRIAATAIKGPNINGSINLGADDIRAGAAAAQDQARAFALIGEAAQRAATEVGDTSEATRLFIAATTASRIEAEQKAAALLSEAGALERVEIELRQSAEAVDLFVGKHQQIAIAAEQDKLLALSATEAAAAQRALAASADVLRAQIDPMFIAQQRFDQELTRADVLLNAGTISQREHAQAIQFAREALYAHALAVGGSTASQGRLTVSTGQQKAAMQQLSYQISDVSTSFAGGINPMVIFAQQGSQVIQALTLMKGEAGGLIGFLGGPWGAAILGAVSVLGVLIDKQLTAAAAEDAHSKAADLLAAAMKRLSDAAADQNHKTEQGIRLDIQAAQTARARAVEELRLAKAKLGAAQATEQIPGGTVPGAAIPGRGVGTLGVQITSLDAQIAAATKDIRVGQVQLSLRRLEASMDAGTAATRRYENTIDRLSRRRESGEISQESFNQLSRIAAERRDRVQEAAKTVGDPTAAISQRRQQIADLEKLKVTASGKDLEGIKRQIALREKQIRYLEQGVGVGSAVAATQGGGGSGKRGPSTETLAKRAEAARVKLLNDDTAYADEERQARHRLLDAMKKTAATEEQRDALVREDINAEADAQARKIANQRSAGKINAAEEKNLNDLNERNRTQRLLNVTLDRARAKVSAQFEADQSDLQSRLAVLRIRQDMALTEGERRRIGSEILAIEQELRRKALENLRDTSDDPNKVQLAKDALGRLPTQEAAERDQQAQRTSDPLDQYRQRLEGTVGSADALKTTLESIEVRGLDRATDDLAGAVTQALKLKGIAGDIVQEFLKIAFQKALFALFPFAQGTVPGFATGRIPGYADGVIRGPGTGLSDSILALMEGKGLIRVSNGESILTAAATRANGPWLKAMNRGLKLPSFATGSVPVLRYPTLRVSGPSGGQQGMREMLYVQVDKSELFDVHVQRASAPLAQRAAIAGSQLAQNDIAEQRMQAIPL
ncbi:phage tail length tape measure family protein [Sphingomonas immobilis]|uniref:Phage tail length tape measure family protein n=1 Tax=Sphingomonas immobilis TaxID=3063997 RepID=A0ABT9A3Z8_9SPHN|nr:phage tail length tape measure family protein [Sphingomonas sp. CA1-15]MDO7843457.1 phage tail length tape measure family protein [Sphingomonas sp. CA1-15]